MVFVDTSAFVAVLDRDDAHHATAADTWRRLLEDGSHLFCTNYVLLETAALLQHRFGLEAVRLFQQDIAPLLEVEWVTPEIHQTAMAAVFAADRRRLSLTDCVSFEVMRRRSIRQFFAFDRHFAEQGFEPTGLK